MCLKKAHSNQRLTSTKLMDQWLSALPKIELHLHLEGAIPLPALWELVRKYDTDNLINSIEALERKFAYRDFPHFLEVWNWKNQYIRETDDFVFLSEAFAKSLVQQNIVYAEVFFSPSDFHTTGMRVGEIAAAIRKGLSRVDGTHVNLVADLVRDNGPSAASRVLDEVYESRDQGILGIGIGGAEQLHPAALFKDVFHRARDMGFHTTAHAGEAAGAASVADAVNLLKVERVGHATRAIEDPDIVELLREKSIFVEACPISNLRTGVTSEIGDHPIRHYFDAGIPVSVNTDDPAMFNCTMVEELQMCVEHHQFTRPEITQMMRSAVDHAWCTEDEKVDLRSQFEE